MSLLEQLEDLAVKSELDRASELLAKIEHELGRQGELDDRLARVLRGRAPELAPARAKTANLRAMFPSTSGSELDSLAQETQQLEVAPPMSEAERQRLIDELSLREAQRLNGSPDRPPSQPVTPPPSRPPNGGRRPPYAAEKTARQRFFGTD